MNQLKPRDILWVEKLGMEFEEALQLLLFMAEFGNSSRSKAELQINIHQVQELIAAKEIEKMLRDE